MNKRPAESVWVRSSSRRIDNDVGRRGVKDLGLQGKSLPVLSIHYDIGSHRFLQRALLKIMG